MQQAGHLELTAITELLLPRKRLYVKHGIVQIAAAGGRNICPAKEVIMAAS
jgi:hypothetical protein